MLRHLKVTCERLATNRRNEGAEEVVKKEGVGRGEGGASMFPSHLEIKASFKKVPTVNK